MIATTVDNAIAERITVSQFGQILPLVTFGGCDSGVASTNFLPVATTARVFAALH
jgi:hypothetical protein